MRKLFWIAVVMLFGVVGLANAQEGSTITLQSDAQVFSGLVYDQTLGALLVSSATDGQIYQVSAEGGLTSLIHSDALTSVGALTIDGSSNRLYVVSSSAGAFLGGGQLPGGFPTPEGGFPQGGPSGGTPPAGFPGNGTPPAGFPGNGQMPSLSASLFAFDLGNGQQVFQIDLTKIAPQGGGLIGQAVVDSSGNVFLTDTAAAAIYRVDASGAPTYLSDQNFQAQGMGGIRGIAYDASGLLVSKAADGSIYHVDLTSGSVQPVQVSNAPTSLSALAMLSDGRLVALDSTESKVVVLTSTDNWQTAQVSSDLTVSQGATALTANGTTLYVLESNFDPNKQSNGSTTPQFSISTFEL